MTIAGHHVLVAEDTSVVATIIRRTLEEFGFTVTVARNGLEAWEKAQTEQFDAVLTDDQMPEMSGSELCEKLRQLERYAKTPIIMITAEASKLENSEMRSNLKIAALVKKPFRPESLLPIVAECMDV